MECEKDNNDSGLIRSTNVPSSVSFLALMYTIAKFKFANVTNSCSCVACNLLIQRQKNFFLIQAVIIMKEIFFYI